MSLKANIKGVRDYIVDKLIAAWTDTNVSKEGAEISNQSGVAYVTLAGVEISAQTIRGDQAVLSFVIAGEWPVTAGLADEMVDRACDARIQLLSDHKAGGFGYLPMVESMDFAQVSAIDEVYQISMVYRCTVTADRS